MLPGFLDKKVVDGNSITFKTMQGSLVLFLRQKGIEAYRFDRFAFDNPALGNSDWFEYKFEKDKSTKIKRLK